MAGVVRLSTTSVQTLGVSSSPFTSFAATLSSPCLPPNLNYDKRLRLLSSSPSCSSPRYSASGLRSHSLLRRPNSKVVRVKVDESVTEAEPPKWWERNAPNMVDIHSTEEFLKALSEAGERLVIVEFYGTWCASCRALFPKLCKTAVENPNIVFLKVNFDENKPMCKSLNVKVLPYFHFYRGADGQKLLTQQNAREMAMKSVWIILLCLFVIAEADQGFDVRHHLSTVTRYSASKEVSQNLIEGSNVPSECTPIHLNLVARHGTRSPTKKRLRELENLSGRLKELVRDAEASDKVPGWLGKWISPWKGKVKGGELIRQGEEELYQLGIRVRERFPTLFEEDYHPDVYTIRATQIPRASASAVAFGMGFFSEKGDLGPGSNRAFAVTSENRASDTKLRFFECCQNYKSYRKAKGPAVDMLKEPVLDKITASVAKRHGLNFTKQDVSSLWFLCKQEASLLNVTNQSCELFTPSEVALLEWADDLEVFILKGYGNSLNYRMGVPLLEDVFYSMEEAIKAREDKLPPGSYEKARLRFAHAETIVPFSCLLGLFLDGSEYEKIQKEKPLELPPQPPKTRDFRGSTMAPFGGNNMLVLYSCPAASSPKYFVQVLHNEHPIALPGCDGKDFCPLEDFKAKVVTPHLKHAFDNLCNANLDDPKQEHQSLWSWLLGSSQKTEL